MTPAREESRSCAKCERQKTLSEFKRNKNKPGGYAKICKLCHSEAEKRRYAANPERFRAGARRQYEANKEEVLARQRARYSSDPEFRKRSAAASKAWHVTHPDVLKQASLRWKKANPDKARAQCRLYKKRHPDVVNAGIQRRRAWKLSALAQRVTAEMLDERASVFGNACAYCGGLHEHWDHVIPLSRGGKHCLANLRPSCASCNLSKGSKTLSEWLRPKEAA